MEPGVRSPRGGLWMPGAGKALGRPSGDSQQQLPHAAALQGRPEAGEGLGRPGANGRYQALPVNHLLCILPL